MTTSMMLRLKISKTKKRLSDDSWHSRMLIIMIFGLMVILSFCLRSTVLSAVFGVVRSEFPVLHQLLEDPALHGFNEIPNAWITKTTPVVVLTDTEFYFGDLESFSSKFSEVRNKFIVKHDQGAPNMPELMETMVKWESHRASLQQNLDNQGILILLPTEEIPMPIVLQVMAALRTSPAYQRIVLANGLL